MKSIVCTLIAAALLVGCATPGRPPMALTIPNAKPEVVRATAVTLMVSDGWRPIQAGDLMLQFEKDASLAAQIFLQELGGQPVRHQFSLTIVGLTNEVRLFGSLDTVTTRWGTPQRHSNDQQEARVMHMMQTIAAKATGAEPPPPYVPPPSKPARSGKAFQR